MTHLGLIVVGTLGTVAYVELYRDKPIEDLDLLRELDDFVFGHGHAEVPLFEDYELRAPVRTFEVIERVFTDPFISLPLHMRTVGPPHFRDLEFKGRGTKSRVLQYKSLKK